MRQRAAAALLVAGLGAGVAQAQLPGTQWCAGDVCVGENVVSNAATPNWAKTPFDKCPTAANGGCGLPPSRLTREVRCERGIGARTSGLASWMPVEYPQTDAAMGGILTYKEVRFRSASA